MHKFFINLAFFDHEPEEQNRKKRTPLILILIPNFSNMSYTYKCCGFRSGIRCFLTSGSGMGKNGDLDPGSEINITDNLSEILEAIIRVKNMDPDP